ncbi:MAG: ABC transporter permease subunit [Dictyoglomaceae bacterium]
MKTSLNYKILFWILFIITWYLMGRVIHSNLILPYPHKVLYKIIDLLKNPYFYQHLIATMLRGIMGLLLALIFGLIFGIIKNPYVYNSIRSIIDLFQSNPLIVWITLALFWFGFGDKTIIFIVFVVLFPNFYLNTYNAIKNMPREYIELFKIYPVCKKKYFLKFLIPYLKPFLLPSFAISIVSSFKISAMAEFFSGEKGIGFLISYAKTFLNVEEVYAYALFLFLLSKSSEFIFQRTGFLRESVKNGFFKTN